MSLLLRRFWSHEGLVPTRLHPSFFDPSPVDTRSWTFPTTILPDNGQEGGQEAERETDKEKGEGSTGLSTRRTILQTSFVYSVRPLSPRTHGSQVGGVNPEVPRTPWANGEGGPSYPLVPKPELPYRGSRHLKLYSC